MALIAGWNQPVYRKYEMVTDKVKKGFTIVHLSDLHSTKYGKDQKRLLKKIKDADPDIILMTGDMVDDLRDEEAAYTLMEGLSEYRIYYVIGNHEVWHEDTAKVISDMESLGVIHMANESDEIEVNGQTVNLLGILDTNALGIKKDRSKKTGVVKSFVDRAIEETGVMEMETEDNFTILLSHRPEYMEVYNEYPIDLVLAGHAHGGQFRVPLLLNGLYSPNQGIFPEYAGGMYEEETTMIVSRGLSLNTIAPRLFNPPEVVVIEVKAK